ncbi:hypothetical protein ACFSCX_20190 [Bacillus salitolerans]|uniref:Uncharacterized protein n=1 Tax=Bacillus salitolerans TaxID=1437434 RepID=A0ABW4LUX1_9BACI
MDSEENTKSTSVLRFSLYYLKDHPEFEEIEMKIPTTRYNVDGENIVIISGKGEIIKVNMDGEWKSPENKRMLGK